MSRCQTEADEHRRKARDRMRVVRQRNKQQREAARTKLCCANSLRSNCSSEHRACSHTRPSRKPALDYATEDADGVPDSDTDAEGESDPEYPQV